MKAVAPLHMQVLHFRVELKSDWTAGGVASLICCILCCSWSGLLREAGLTVVLVLFQLVLCQNLRHPETHLEEVDQGLAQVLLCPVTV